MSIIQEHTPSALQAPAHLAETGYGFHGHLLALSLKERQQHDRIFASSLGNRAVLGALSELLVVGDEATHDHGLRTGWLFAAQAVRIGLPRRDAVIGTQAAITHDVGKRTPAIQEAIKSDLSVADHPELYDAICDHPEETVRVYQQRGLGPNHQIISGNHHGFGSRRSYGVGGTIAAVPEHDGYLPMTAAMTYMLPPADTYDSLSVSPELSGRAYLNGMEVGHDPAVDAVDTLKIPSFYRNLPAQVVARPI